jgi:NAD(P)-dependent dehydrogenase (short-subunit alcohol dehydrogenase family)
MVGELEKDWGGIDILVNNAGLTQILPFALIDEEDWDHVMDINVKGTFLTSRSALRGMIRRKRGVVLNIGSLVAVRMMEAPVHYCASKAAVKGLSEALAKEVARYGIRVLCLAPGLLEDGVGRNLPDYRLADYLRHCSLGRLGGLAEVARFAAFLVSDANSYMSGETVVIDGQSLASTVVLPDFYRRRSFGLAWTNVAVTDDFVRPRVSHVLESTKAASVGASASRST